MGSEINSLKQSLFPHTDLVRKMAQNALGSGSPSLLNSDETNTLSGILEPAVNSLWNKLAQNLSKENFGQGF